MTAEDKAEIARLQRVAWRERTARLEAEAIAESGVRELYEANRALDERVKNRTAELGVAIQEAQIANAAKSVFLASLSHELRTPLHGMVGMLELLDNAAFDDEERAWFESAKQSADRLNRLFTRLLRFVDLDASRTGGEVAPGSAVPLSVFLEDAASRWMIECARVGQLLSVDHGSLPDLPVLWTSETGLVLDELLSNAVAHADSGSVRLFAESDGALVRLSVHDSGPGIAPELLDVQIRLMEPPLDQSRRADLGAGLGLALIQRASEAIGASWGLGLEQGGTLGWIELSTAGPS